MTHPSDDALDFHYSCLERAPELTTRQEATSLPPPTPGKEALDRIIEAASHVTQIWFGEAWTDPTAPDSDFNSEMDKLAIALQELRR